MISYLKKHVTLFSEELNYRGSDGEEVICGGKIVRVIDETHLLGDLADESKCFVYVSLDDYVGQLNVVIPKLLWNELHAKIDDLILCTGVIHSLEKEHIQYVMNEKEKDAWMESGLTLQEFAGNRRNRKLNRIDPKRVIVYDAMLIAKDEIQKSMEENPESV
jgi:hypothetical protein